MARGVSHVQRLRQAVNSGLGNLIGYELVKSNSHGPHRRTRAHATSTRGSHAQRVRRHGSKPTGRKKRAAPLPADIDDVSRQIITAVRPRTMTSPEKIYGLISSVRYVVRHGIPGDIVECGVWRGGSMQAVAMTLQSLGVTDRHLQLFDTYEGMPPPDEIDRRRDGRSASELMAVSDRSAYVWAVADLADVRTGMEAVGYPRDRVHYVQGMVEDTVPGRAPGQISILRLDTDWYASTRHELTHLYPRVSPGGVLIIDDYGYWDGSRKATEEFLEDTGARLLLLRAAAGRIGVKP